MRQLKPKLAIGLAGVLAMLGGGCGFAGSEKSSSTGAADSKDVTVGFIGPLTGEYSVYGKPALQAVELAVDEWNAKGGLLGKQIKIDSGDSQGDPKQAATLARGYVDKKVNLLLGPTFSLEAESAVPILCANNITAVTGLADLIDPEGSPCYFRTSPREDHANAFLARLISEYLNAKKVAIIDDGKSDTVRSTKFMNQYLKGHADVVFSGSVTAGKQDYSSTLTKVKSLDPDAIALSTTLPETPILRKQGANLGIDADWVVNLANDGPEFKKIAGPRGVSTFSASPAHSAERFDEFASAYEAKFDEEPASFNEYAYDAANALFTAVSSAKSFESEKVTAAMHDLEDFQGVTGPITFDETGSRGQEVFDAIEYRDDQKWSNVSDVPFDH